MSKHKKIMSFISDVLFQMECLIHKNPRKFGPHEMKLATLSTQVIGRRQTKQIKQKHRKLKRLTTRTPLKTGDEPMCLCPLIRHLPCYSYSEYVLDTTT